MRIAPARRPAADTCPPPAPTYPHGDVEIAVPLA